MNITELIRMIPQSNEQKAMSDTLAQHGSQSPEYRRAWRRQYRSYARRVDFYADKPAAKALDAAMVQGWALSQSDAINQALTAWAEWMAEDDCPE